jgi:hypothetical protein
MTLIHVPDDYDDEEDEEEIHLCPKCGGVLEVDEEYMAKHYGEAYWEDDFPLSKTLFWCEDCEEEVYLK